MAVLAEMQHLALCLHCQWLSRQLRIQQRSRSASAPTKVSAWHAELQTPLCNPSPVLAGNGSACLAPFCPRLLLLGGDKPYFMQTGVLGQGGI